MECPPKQCDIQLLVMFSVQDKAPALPDPLHEPMMVAPPEIPLDPSGNLGKVEKVELGWLVCG